MQYKRYSLKEVYEYINEGEEEELSMAQIMNLPAKSLENYLAAFKQQDPEAFGKLLVKSFTNPTSKQKILAAFKQRI